MNVDKVFAKLLANGEIDILTFRYYTRMISLAEDAILSGKRKMSLKPIGEEIIRHHVVVRKEARFL